ncbi:MAG TPA: class I SAM-dependent methyltransferase [Reyranella sp.]|nr:class I SAM-dependent methyltransferase [Reyranella sp.]
MSLKRAAQAVVQKLIIDPIRWLDDRTTRTHLRADSVYKIISDRAAQRAADYVEKHLDTALMFQAREGLWNFALSKAPRDGLHLEFGVMTGVSTNHFARARRNATIYGFDSFEGLKEDWPGTEAPAGAYRAAKPTDMEANVVLVEGWFDATLPTFLAQHAGPCSFLHVDCDTYPSTRLVLDLLADRIVAGTVIVFDDYIAVPNWENGEFCAFKEFVAARGLNYKYLAFANQQSAVQIV